MIVTLTPNPSIDRAISIDALKRGEVLRATSSHSDAGGKGVNVSRALSAHGAQTLAILPVGGLEGQVLSSLLNEAGVSHHGVAVAGSVRTNISILEPDGTTTKLNELGPSLSPSEVEALTLAAVDGARGADWVVACGSLPEGVPADFYATLAPAVRSRGARLAIDTSGAPLAHAVAARPDLIKPNHEELAELVGHELPTLGDVIGAARDLVAHGIQIVAVSLGADGALVVTVDEVAHARASISQLLSTVGAGDCMLAGMLHGLTEGMSCSAALARGVQWGAAAVTLPGSSVPAPADVLGIVAELVFDPPHTLVLGH